MATAFDYVIKTLGINQNDDESRDDYLQRVASKIQQLSEDEWNAMPVSLQDWYNGMADALVESEDLEFKDIPGMKKSVDKKKVVVEELVEEQKIEKADEADEADEEPVKESGKKAPKTRAKKEKGEPKLKKEKVPKEPRGPIAANAVREIICEDIGISLDGLMTKLEERGVTMQRSSAQVVHLNTIRAFEVAIEVGKVKRGSDMVLITP